MLFLLFQAQPVPEVIAPGRSSNVPFYERTVGTGSGA